MTWKFGDDLPPDKICHPPFLFEKTEGDARWVPQVRKQKIVTTIKGYFIEEH